MLARLLNGLSAAAGAAAAAQFPAFYTQYLQQVSGRLSQAMADIAPVARDARDRGMSVVDFLERAGREGGELTGTLVEGYRSTFETLRRLEEAYIALRTAGPLERPLAFVSHFHSDVAGGTLRDFAPALPLSAEGAAYAGAGLLLGIALAWGLERTWRRWRDRHRQRRHAERSKGA